MKQKKRVHIFFYWIWMIILFMVVLLAQQIAASILQGSLSTARYGFEATFEILWAGFVVLVILLFKNKYIFTQEREGFFKSFKYMLPELLIAVFFGGIGLLSIAFGKSPVEYKAVINLFIYCTFIGIVEEFLCRGWLLNEFLERYSRNRKEIILSIIFSSIIFGVIHFLNIGETQGFFETLVQVMNAAASGTFLALLYYKTKNIWVVVFTHAFWDFSIFLTQVSSLGDCISGPTSTSAVILNIIRGICITISLLVLCYWLYRQTDLYVKNNKSKKDYLIGIGVAAYIFSLLFINDFSSTDSQMCPDYERKDIDSNYVISYYNYDSYKLGDSLVLEYNKESGNIQFKNTKSKKYINLTDDSKFDDYLLIDNGTTYSIIILKSEKLVYYGNYPTNKLDDSQEYLDSVRDGLKKVVVPDAEELGIIEFDGDEYKFPLLRTSIRKYMFFDRKGNLYMKTNK